MQYSYSTLKRLKYHTMNARLERIFVKEDESFSIGIFQDNLEKSTWHYHNNYELSFIMEGTGKRIVGDSIVDFQPGDLVFIGPTLPHLWVADKDSWNPSNRFLAMVFLQFNSDILCPHLLAFPEFKNIATALKYSERGIQVIGQTLNLVSEIMLQLPYMKNFERMLNFLRLMNIIGESEININLASTEYLRKRLNTNSKRISMIHEFLMNNYRNNVNLSELAELVNMAKGSICHFFKMHMGLTLFEYLNQIKVDFACKLLMDPDLSIMEVGYNSGFNNISHFNKQFRSITGISPSEYRKKFKNLI